MDRTTAPAHVPRDALQRVLAGAMAYACSRDDRAALAIVMSAPEIELHRLPFAVGLVDELAPDLVAGFLVAAATDGDRAGVLAAALASRRPAPGHLCPAC
jgi:hypothetical protein